MPFSILFLGGKNNVLSEILNRTNEDIITANEVAEIFKIGRVKAYELLKTGEIASFRVGKRNIRTTQRAVLNYIEKRREKENG